VVLLGMRKELVMKYRQIGLTVLIAASMVGCGIQDKVLAGLFTVQGAAVVLSLNHSASPEVRSMLVQVANATSTAISDYQSSDSLPVKLGKIQDLYEPILTNALKLSDDDKVLVSVLVDDVRYLLNTLVDAYPAAVTAHRNLKIEQSVTVLTYKQKLQVKEILYQNVELLKNLGLE